MSDKKRRFFRLIEHYINDFRKEAIEEMYGVGTKIRIHSMSESLTDKSILFEVVIVLDVLNNDAVAVTSSPGVF